MVLLDVIVEVLTLPQFARVWQGTFRFQLLECLWIGRVFINRDDSRSAGMRRSKRFREEVFGCVGISCGTEEKFQGVALRIHGTIEIHPCLFHFHIGLIDASRIVRHLEMWPTALLQFWRFVLHESGRSSCDRHIYPA